MKKLHATMVVLLVLALCVPAFAARPDMKEVNDAIAKNVQAEANEVLPESDYTDSLKSMNSFLNDTYQKYLGKVSGGFRPRWKHVTEALVRVYTNCSSVISLEKDGTRVLVGTNISALVAVTDLSEKEGADKIFSYVHWIKGSYKFHPEYDPIPPFWNNDFIVCNDQEGVGKTPVLEVLFNLKPENQKLFKPIK